jgi:ADP-heptose:LPS heptosyltransferase
MGKQEKHRVPFLVKLFRIKNRGFLTIVDKLIRLIKPPKICKEHPGEILFIRNDKIGDAYVTLPVLRNLKLNYPSLTIDVLCSKRNYFVFKDQPYINKLHIYEPENLNELERKLKAEKYQAIVDLVSIDKKLIIRMRRCAPFIAGSRIFGFSWIYNYYLHTNWDTESDIEPMALKIEKLLTDCFGYKFRKKDSTLPFYKNTKPEGINKDYDIFMHLGTGEIRKLDMDKEENLIDMLGKYKILITDGQETDRFSYYKSKYSGNENISFRLYSLLSDITRDVARSKIVLCYDGGQAHFMGQFERCIILAGAVSPMQWAPFDFSVYTEFKKWENGVNAVISGGEKKHVALFYPVWCCPCFDIGCALRPCINKITPEQVIEIIEASINKTI